VGLIKEGAKDFCVRQTAIDILFHNGVPPKDYLGEIRTLFVWVQNNVRYTRDIHRVELLHSARRMLELRAGDCDDMTILLAAMLKAIGHPVRLVLVGFNPNRKTVFTHIYLEASYKGWWIPLDPTVNRPPGWAPPADHKQVFPVD
jgi:transglutaminase-like putative cysteine protease